MPIPINSGPNYSNREVSGKAPGSRFIPEIWSSKLVQKFYDATVFGAITNTDYEGVISDMGDRVIIRTTPNITINDYQKGMNLTYENPESPSVELSIDYGKYFGFTCDDVDALQSDLNLLDNWGVEASEQMKVAVDADVLGSIYADVDDKNQGTAAGRKSGSFNLGETGAPVSITKDNALDYIVDLGTVLDEQNVPQTGRFLVVPAWFAGMIKKSDLKDASIAGDGTSILRNGRLGTIDRFTLFLSNSVGSADEVGGLAYHMLAGHKAATTFASQMTKMETLRNPTQFGDLVRGLNVFGFEVIKPDCLAHLYAVKG